MPYSADVETYLNAIADLVQQADTRELVDRISRITGTQPKMWGSIIGFGDVHYKYESGHEGDTMIIGLAARKQAITLYGLIYYEQNRDKLERLGKYKTGKGCLYVKRLTDIDVSVLDGMIKQAWEHPVLGTSEAA